MENKENTPIVVTEEEGGALLKLRINTPEEKNGLNWKALEILADCYERAIEDKNIRAILITGDDKYFHTGGRVNAEDPEEQRKYSDGIERMQKLQDKLTIPLIAAVSGDCLKGGMGLLADADLAIARKGVMFGFPEVRMGGVPMMVMAQTINMPKKMSLEAYYSSEYFSAEDALRMGLVNCVVPPEEFWPTVNRYVHMVIDKPRALIEMTRYAYYSMVEMPSKKERSRFAMEMLRTKVLKEMQNGKTEHNV